MRSVGCQKRDDLQALIMRVAKLYREAPKELRIRVGEKMLGGNGSEGFKLS